MGVLRFRRLACPSFEIHHITGAFCVSFEPVYASTYSSHTGRNLDRAIDTHLSTDEISITRSQPPVKTLKRSFCIVELGLLLPLRGQFDVRPRLLQLSQCSGQGPSIHVLRTDPMDKGTDTCPEGSTVAGSGTTSHEPPSRTGEQFSNVRGAQLDLTGDISLTRGTLTPPGLRVSLWHERPSVVLPYPWRLGLVRDNSTQFANELGKAGEVQDVHAVLEVWNPRQHPGWADAFIRRLD